MTRALLLFLALAATATAQPGRPARLYVIADSVSPGERVRVAVAVDHAAGVQTLFPAVPSLFPEAAPGLVFGDAEALSVRRLPPRIAGAVRTDSAVYETAVFAVDQARIGPIAVQQVRNGDTLRVETGVAVVPVRSLAQAIDDPGPVGPADPFPSRVPVLAGAGVLALAALGAMVWAVRRRRVAPAVPIAPRLAPYPEAVAALDRLDGAQPATPANVEAHVDALKDVLRVYVGRRLGVPAERLTTDELTDRLAALDTLPETARRQVRAVLRVADLVDFAAARPGVDAVADARARTREAVESVEAAVRDTESVPALP